MGQHQLPQSQVVSRRDCVAAEPSVPGEGKPDATVLHEPSSRTAVFRPAAGSSMSSRELQCWERFTSEGGFRSTYLNSFVSLLGL